MEEETKEKKKDGKEKDKRLTWEWRIFWPEYDAARDALGEFSFIDGKMKKRVEEKNNDTYYYLPNTFLNVKIREEDIVFKLMHEKKGDYCGYGKKKTFPFPVAAEELPVFLPDRGASFASQAELLAALVDHYPSSKVYEVVKQRASATFVQPDEDKEAKLKAEYAVIDCGGRTFQTLCLESKHRKWLKTTVKKLDGGGIVCDYFRLLGLLTFKKL
jgi:hypothetical protein